MKLCILKSILVLVICSLSTAISAQEKKIDKATLDYDNYSYVDARKRYLKLANKGYNTADIYKRLGDSYYFTAEYKDAAQWYERLFDDKTDKNNESIDPEYYFRYAQSLKSIKRYDLAHVQMEKFRSFKGDDSRGKKFESNRNYLEEIQNRSEHYSISPTFFNSELQDFGPSFYGERVVFSSNRKNVTGDLKHNWNNQPFLDLFIVDDPRTSEDPEITKFSTVLNTSYHESTSVFNESGDIIYFTRSNYTKKKKLQQDYSGTTKLKLFRSIKENGKWSKPEELPFNSDNYSTAHPALSPDEKTLYFASDRPGTKGLSDIWKVAILDNGEFGETTNLGDIINTEARESFPFVNSSNEIFYASDGHSGLGGLDIFTSSLGSDGAITETYNVGEPLNSSKDDFGFVFNDQKQIGYFASNREGGLGNDDIYIIKKEIIDESVAPAPCKQSIAGIVRDIDTQRIIIGAKVTLSDSDNNLISTQISDSQGRFSFLENPCETPYFIKASKNKYDVIEASLSTGETHNVVVNKDLLLKSKLQLKVGDDLAKVLNLNPIYFDYDKSYIRPDASYELEKVIKVMNEYPSLKIDVRSHTDSRGRDSYNLGLSRRRNSSTKNYIIQKGVINSSRITGSGYGETQLVNQCSNGVTCSDEDHQLNRRSEFIIIQR